MTVGQHRLAAALAFRSKSVTNQRLTMVEHNHTKYVGAASGGATIVDETNGGR